MEQAVQLRHSYFQYVFRIFLNKVSVFFPLFRYGLDIVTESHTRGKKECQTSIFDLLCGYTNTYTVMKKSHVLKFNLHISVSHIFSFFFKKCLYLCIL